MNKTLIIFSTLLFCLTSSVGWSLTMKDLEYRDGFHYKKFTDVPFTWKIDGQFNGLIENGKREGSWVQYFDNGLLYFKGDYKNGKREGYWVTYNYDGKLQYITNHKNGKLEGSWVRYWRNGKLLSKGNFKNNMREGSWDDYNKDGTINKEETVTYKDGVKISD